MEIIGKIWKLLFGAIAVYYIIAFGMVIVILGAFLYQSYSLQPKKYKYNRNDHAGFIADQIKKCTELFYSSPTFTQSECTCFVSKAENHVDLPKTKNLTAQVRKNFYSKKYDMPLTVKALEDSFYKADHPVSYYHILSVNEPDPLKKKLYSTFSYKLSLPAIRARKQKRLYERVMDAGVDTCVSRERQQEANGKIRIIRAMLPSIFKEVRRVNNIRERDKLKAATTR